MERHPDNPPTAQWAIELLASRRFKRYLRITQSKQVRIFIVLLFGRQPRYDGKWVIETNDDTISLEDAACGIQGG